MADLLIRGVDADVIAAIDARAGSLGLSRNEFLKRELGWLAASGAVAVTLDDLRDFSRVFADLADGEVMSKAWG